MPVNFGHWCNLWGLTCWYSFDTGTALTLLPLPGNQQLAGMPHVPGWPATGIGKILLMEAVWKNISEEKKPLKMHPASLAQCKD